MTRASEADPYALEFVDPADGHDAKVPQCDDYSRSAWHGNYTWTDQESLSERLRRLACMKSAQKGVAGAAASQVWRRAVGGAAVVHL